MRITITSHGTRGDVQPYLALAVGLKEAGHQVTLCTSDNYTGWIRSYGIGVHPTQFSIQEYMKIPEVKAVLEGRNFIKKLSVFREMMGQGPGAVGDVWDSIQGADYVIESPTSVGMLEAASVLGLSGALALPVPFAPTREYPSIFLGPIRFSPGGSYNLLTHKFMHAALWGSMRGPMTKALRKKLDLPRIGSFAALGKAMRQQGLPTIYGVSEHVLPRPRDWGSDQFMTGYWFLEKPEDWQPDPALVDFIEAGAPPVYVGFGSISPGESKNKTEIILEALETAGKRAVISSGWGGLAQLPATERVFYVQDIPHDWLFPRMSALVHHGGAGTTAAGLRAGIPSIIVPVAADQYFWAERVLKLGAGPRSPDAKNLAPDKLARAIQEASETPAIRSAASSLGEKIRKEDGVKRAIELFEGQAVP